MDATMNANLLDAISTLPVEIQTMVVAEKVKKREAINLADSNVQAGLDALVSPFANHPSLLKIAEAEVVHVNKLKVSATSSIVTWKEGIPSIVSTATGQTLTKCSSIRHLEVVLHNTVQGADWNSTNPVVLPTSTTTLLAVLPTIFPGLNDIAFQIINVGLVDASAQYTKWHITRPAAACPDSKQAEKASRMYQLIRTAHETIFPRWRRNEPVRKSVLFVQSIRYGAKGEGPCVEVKSGPNSFHNQNNIGLTMKTQKRMWALCDWPLARIVFV